MDVTVTDKKYFNGKWNGHLFNLDMETKQLLLNMNYRKGSKVYNLTTKDTGTVVGCYWGTKGLQPYAKFTVENDRTGKRSNWKVDNTVLL